MKTKPCSHCKKIKAVLNFRTCKHTKSGYQSWCIQCTAESQKKYRLKHREEFLQKSREYYLQNRITHLKKCKEYRKNNHDYIRRYRRQHYLGIANNKVITGLNKRPHPGVCELCPQSSRLYYHHWDDSNYSKGIWLCRICHSFVHRLIYLDKYLKLKKELDSTS